MLYNKYGQEFVDHLEAIADEFVLGDETQQDMIMILIRNMLLAVQEIIEYET